METVYGHEDCIGRRVGHEAEPVAKSGVELGLGRKSRFDIALFPEFVDNIGAALIEIGHILGRLGVGKKAIVDLRSGRER